MAYPTFGGPGRPTVSVANADNVVRRISAYGRKLEDWPMLWAEVSQSYADAERAWFKSEGEGSWPELKPATVAYKARHFPGRPILVRTGELRASLTEHLALMVEADVLLIGTEVEWAEFHVTGTRVMPKRDPRIPIVHARELARTAMAEHARYP